MLENVSQENNHIYLLGDYNIDLNQAVNSSATTLSASINISMDQNVNNGSEINDNVNCIGNRFLNILFSHAFFPCINKPTRITSSSSTLIDNILTNTCNKDNRSGILKEYGLIDGL